MYSYPSCTMHNVTGTRDEGERIGSPKKNKREAKKAQPAVQTLASPLNKFLPEGV